MYDHELVHELRTSHQECSIKMIDWIKWRKTNKVTLKRRSEANRVVWARGSREMQRAHHMGKAWQETVLVKRTWKKASVSKCGKWGLESIGLEMCWRRQRSSNGLTCSSGLVAHVKDLDLQRAPASEVL